MPEPDLSEFIAMSKPKRLSCSVAEALKTLSKADRGKLEAALAAGQAITHSAVAQWLSAREIKISQYTISRHRRGMCSCDA